jgi:predicted nuclease with TOPRIM domain
MERNNGRIEEENPTMEELQKENTQLKQVLRQAAQEIQQLKYALTLKRADYLLRVIECREFSAEFKVKAIEEFENFMYPQPEQTEQLENKEE